MSTAALYIDIHTHQQRKQAGTVAVQSFLIGQKDDQAPPSSLFSAGMHPWHAEEVDVRNGLDHLRTLAARTECIAIGEIGLDRACNINFPRQRELFTVQSTMAAELNMPIVVHSVRAHADVFMTKNRQTFPETWIVHGFRGKRAAAQQLLHHGAYLSFGEPLLNPTQSLLEAFQAVPRDRLFLETDEAVCDVSKIYTSAAALMDITVAELKTQIHANFIRCFGLEAHDTVLA